MDDADGLVYVQAARSAFVKNGNGYRDSKLMHVSW